MNREELQQSGEGIVDNDLVSFFDLLAQYDFEDRQKEKSDLKTNPSESVSGG